MTWCPSMDRETRRRLEEAVDVAVSASTGRPGVIYLDETGPAIYNVDPAGPCAIVLCPRCGNIALRPGLPEPFLTVRLECVACHLVSLFTPPPEVREAAAAMPGLVSVSPGRLQRATLRRPH